MQLILRGSKKVACGKCGNAQKTDESSVLNFYVGGGHTITVYQNIPFEISDDKAIKLLAHNERIERYEPK